MSSNTKKKVKKYSSFLNNKLDYVLVITILLLLALGVVMVLSASAPSALSETGSSYTYFKRQFFFAIIGINSCEIYVSKSLLPKSKDSISNSSEVFIFSLKSDSSL